MTILYRAVPLSPPPRTCLKLQRHIHHIFCSSASAGAMSGSPAPEPWHTLLSQQTSSEAKTVQTKKRMRKGLRIAGVDQEELVDPWLLADADSRFAELHGVHIHYKIANPTCTDGEGKKDDGSGSASQSSSPSSSSSSSLPSELAEPSSLTWQQHPLSSPLLTTPLHPASSDPSTSSSKPVSSPSNPSLLPLSSTQKPSSPMQPPPLSQIPAILLHGFGASLFSWERVLKPLAKVLGSQVLAFDRPAFGLTSRVQVPLASSATGNPVPLNPYSVSFSSTATIAFVDFLQSSKAILIGHSAGCIVAADAYLKAPERIAAIIMVAPALFAPITLHKRAETREEQNTLLRVFSNIWAKIMWVLNMIGAMLQVVASSIKLLCYRILATILRSDFGCWLIRMAMDKLSLKAVRLAWYDKEKVDDYVIAGYTKPLRCRDWERALLEFVIASIGSPSSNEKEVPLSRRLDEIKCPVLVITGDSDALVPAWNAERLSKALPNAQCHVVKNCGHLPHEEKPEEFLTTIQLFMKRILHSATMETIPNDSMIFMPA